MSIHQNLKALRSARHMTQEQVAAQCHVTRQTISSYESGRTRPDPDTLIRLAEIYGVSVEDILSSQTTQSVHTRRFRLLGRGFIILLALLVLLRSAVMCANQRLYPLPNGVVSDRALLETHLRLSAFWETLDEAALTFSLVGFLLLFLELVWNLSIPFRRRGIFLALLAAALFCASFPFSLADPIFSATDYLVTPFFIFFNVLISQAIAAIAAQLRKRKSSFSGL